MGNGQCGLLDFTFLPTARISLQAQTGRAHPCAVCARTTRTGDPGALYVPEDLAGRFILWYVHMNGSTRTASQCPGAIWFWQTGRRIADIKQSQPQVLAAICG